MSSDQDPQHPEVRLADETISYLRSEMREAVSEGIKAAMTQDAAKAFWGVGLELLQQQATVRAGRFVLDGAWAVLRKLLWVCILLAAIYSVGGWAFVTTVWKALFARG